MKEFTDKLINKLEAESFPTHENHSAVWLDIAIKTIKETVKECNDGWILCSEKLPEDNTRCLTTIAIGGYSEQVGKFNSCVKEVQINTYSKIYGWYPNPNVIAWKELPECYKG